MNVDILKSTIEKLIAKGKGILAADESTGTIKKRFASINTECTEENRRSYRELLFTTPNLNEFISGIILFEETLYQKTQNNQFFSEYLIEHGIVPGIKVDKGLVNLTNIPDYKVTEGLDGLENRISEYKKQNIKFAKWRVVFSVIKAEFNHTAIKINAESLARYAAICQNLDIVPIVEPEILMDGEHTIEDCAIASRQIFNEVFHSLMKHKVLLEGIILKPNMIISGINCQLQANTTEVANKTIDILRETVPSAVPGIFFLSGGQTSEVATANLNNINLAAQNKNLWYLSFSYGRALQDKALKSWAGKSENTTKAQQELYKRAKLNSLATFGKYDLKME